MGLGDDPFGDGFSLKLQVLSGAGFALWASVIYSSRYTLSLKWKMIQIYDAGFDCHFQWVLDYEELFISRKLRAESSVMTVLVGDSPWIATQRNWQKPSPVLHSALAVQSSLWPEETDTETRSLFLLLFSFGHTCRLVMYCKESGLRLPMQFILGLESECTFKGKYTEILH